MDTERFSMKQPQEQAGPQAAAVTVRASGVSKSFQTGGQVIQAVNEVSFTFTEGQFVAIVRPSGSRKSTLLYLLGG